MAAGNPLRMRRGLTVFVLAVLCFPLIAPLLRADAAPELPACCRRGGKHHCAMMDLAAGSSSGQALGSLRSKCPLFPATVGVASAAKIVLLAAAPQTIAPQGFRRTIAFPDRSPLRLALRGPVRKRGPPASLRLDHSVSL
jgi:hypothetical protein